ncbi:MAG: alpha/beta fold hydrolase [Dongiaceae bacterium]
MNNWKLNSNGFAKRLPKADQKLLENPEFQNALRAAGLEQIAAFNQGVALYHRHPHRHQPSPHETLWRHGNITLDYYGAAKKKAKPVLLVPSLINRAYILDLLPEQSFVQYLVDQGFAPYILDWHEPGAIESGWNLSDYISQALLPALTAIIADSGKPPLVLGYCMGGILALGLAALAPQAMKGLIFLATPFDFHTEDKARAKALGQLAEGWRPVLEKNLFPIDVIQALFLSFDPLAGVRKFSSLPERPSAEQRRFVALEDWINDGVPLAGKVAIDALEGWYGSNVIAKNLWRVAGKYVQARYIEVPSLVVVPKHDKIVPPASAAALAEALPDAHCIHVEAGHIGMMASLDAPKQVWPQIVKWCNNV